MPIKRHIRIPKPSKELAWFLGVLAGDGCVRKDRAVMGTVTPDFADKFEEVGHSLFQLTPRQYRIKPKNKKHQTIIVTQFASVELSKYLGNWKSAEWVKTLENKFQWVLTKDSYKIAFLTGLFDSDGCVVITPHEHKIQINCRFPEPRQLVCDLIKSLGISCRNKTPYTREHILVHRKEDSRKLARLLHSCIPLREERLTKTRNIEYIAKPWSDAEDDILLDNINHLSKADLMKKLSGRDWASIQRRAHKLGKHCRDAETHWTTGNEQIMLQYYPNKEMLSKLLPNKTWGAIYTHARRMDLPPSREFCSIYSEG